VRDIGIDFIKDEFLMFVMDQLAYEREKRGQAVIRLTLGKSELPIHGDIIGAMMAALESYDKYALVFPTGLPELKEELAAFYEKKNRLKIDPASIIIGVGTSALMRNLYDSILNDENDEVLIPLPYYPLYKICANLLKTRVRYYRIDLETMALDLESFRQNFNSRTKIVVINSPGNPIGNILTAADLVEIDRIVNGQAVIIFDEIYDNVAFDGPSVNMLDVFNKNGTIKTRSPLVVTNSFSKAYRMYSRRVGWCIVPPELITPLTTIQHHTLLTVDPVDQFAGIEALRHPEELAYIRELYKKKRDYTLQKFKDNSPVRVIPAKGSFYITLDCRDYLKQKRVAHEFELAKKILNDTGVAIVPGSDFGIPGTFRLSYTAQQYNEGIDRLYDFFVNNYM
jgi:aspartate/methionine/tyrosine aminotransferase